MKLPEEELMGEYLSGEVVDPCEYDQLAMEKFDEFLGNYEESNLD